MGQLEKYGLYVLCLLIFLILGVTLWGSGTVGAHVKGSPSNRDLSAGPSIGNILGATALPDSGQKSTKAAAGTKGAEGGRASAARLPDFADLLRPPAQASNTTSPTATPADDIAKKEGSRTASKVGTESTLGAEQPKTDPGRSSTPPAPAQRPTHTIVSGDNYESIALEQFGTRALHSEISRLNPGVDPRRLIPGKKLLMPTQEEVDAILTRRAAKEVGVEVGGMYVIVKGDTLIGIAKSKLGAEKRVAEIQALNPGLDPANLKIGASIRLPKK